MLKFIVFVVAATAFSYYAYSEFDKTFGTKEEPEYTACTLEAKICPDGSSVGRTGPNCEFAACPGE